MFQKAASWWKTYKLKTLQVLLDQFSTLAESSEWKTGLVVNPWSTQQGISAKEGQTIDIFSFMSKYIFHFLPGLVLCKVWAKSLFLSSLSYALDVSMPFFSPNYLNSFLWTRVCFSNNIIDLIPIISAKHNHHNHTGISLSYFISVQGLHQAICCP